MVGRFQKVIFRMTGFDQQNYQVQMKLATIDYSCPLFAQEGLETVSRALVKMPETIKNHNVMLIDRQL